MRLNVVKSLNGKYEGIPMCGGKAGKVELRYEIVGDAKTSAVSCSYHCVRETNSSAQDSSRYICIKANSLVSGFKGQ